MRMRAECPKCGALIFTYDLDVVEPVVKQLQPVLIFAPPEVRALLGGKSAPDLLAMALQHVGAQCRRCALAGLPDLGELLDD